MDPHTGGRPEWDARTPRRLAICGTCGRDFVVIVNGEEHGDAHWRMTLRCGACQAVRDVIASDAEVDVYFDDFDRATERLEARVSWLARERMADEICRLVIALRVDLIGWDDFTR